MPVIPPLANYDICWTTVSHAYATGPPMRDLRDEVNERLAEGFVPHGSLAVVQYPTSPGSLMTFEPCLDQSEQAHARHTCA